MGRIAELCEALTSRVASLGLNPRGALLPGLDVHAMLRETQSLAIELHPELAELYGWSGGMPRRDFCDLFPGYGMLDFGDACSLYREVGADPDDDFLAAPNQIVFPVFESGGGDAYGVVCAGDLYGSVIWHVLHYEPVRVVESLESQLSFLLECVERGVYTADDDGFVETDLERQKALAVSMNPKIEYWRDC